jgi:hypothetical protein
MGTPWAILLAWHLVFSGYLANEIGGCFAFYCGIGGQY